MKKSLKRGIINYVKSTTIKRLWDYFPRRAKFFDGKKRFVNKSIKRMFKRWRSSDDLYREAVRSYGEYSGGDFIDVGAYRGWYSCLLSPKAKKDTAFVSIEPNLEITDELLFNLHFVKKNFDNLRNIVIPYPAGNGEKAIIETAAGVHCRYLSSNVGERRNTERKMYTYKIDDIVKTYNLNPSFIKIDAEGAEKDVIQGSTFVIQKFQPVLMIETHRSGAYEDEVLINSITNKKYEVNKIIKGKSTSQYLLVPSSER